jgi:hypothetical protein
MRVHLAVLALLLPGADASPLGLAEILQANLEARGGLEAIRSVRSFLAEGKLSARDSPPIVLRSAWSRPDRIRVEMDLGGPFAILGGTGQRRWWVSSLHGIVEPEPAPSLFEELQSSGSDFDGPFVDSAAKGLRLALLSPQSVAGRPAWVVEAVREGSPPERITVFIDQETRLEVREVRKVDENGIAFAFDYHFGDYRPVAGLLLPHRFESPGAAIQLESIRINAPLPPAMFDWPAGAPRPTLARSRSTQSK